MHQTDTPPYETRSAVLFLIFNRPGTTRRVFDAIKAAKPKRLYIAADGPREDFPDDELLCRQTREIVAEIDWDCAVKKLFRDVNAGCKYGVSDAISWFFDREDEGIILEDDCLPAGSFFKFCDVLLEKYRGDDRVRHITGCNLQAGKKWGKASYYFSNRTHVWGWASWKRVWIDYDAGLNKYNRDEIQRQLLNIYDDPLVAESWAGVFDGLKTGQINSWAYPLDFANFFNNGLVIIPNENLISNIGFGSNMTNPTYKKSIFDHVPLSEIDEIIHPVFILPEKQADLFIINHNFNIDERRRKQKTIKYKIKKWIKKMFHKG